MVWVCQLPHQAGGSWSPFLVNSRLCPAIQPNTGNVVPFRIFDPITQSPVQGVRVELQGRSPHLATSFSGAAVVQGTPSFPYTLVGSGSPAEETGEKEDVICVPGTT